MDMSDQASPPPLDGLTVLDFTRVLSGPYCTMLLADMGARVIKIEQPGRGDDTRAWGPPFLGTESAYFLSINRNKESLTLDLKNPASRTVLDGLLDRADILVENFRPGTMERLGLAYADVSERRPRLIYCSISGFGQTGPRREQAGYDAVVQAEGGLMSLTGDADGPPFRLGVAISDIVSGMFAAQGIAMALIARERTGRGQLVDVGMLDATAALLTYQAAICFATGAAPRRMGNRHPTIVPYETFAAADGDVVVAVGTDDQWQRFCRVADLLELANDVRFTTNRSRVENYDTLRPLLAEQAQDANQRGVVERLQDPPACRAAPCGTSARCSTIRSSPIATWSRRSSMRRSGRCALLGVPIKLSETPGSVRTAPPTLGQHTDGHPSR